MVQSRKEIKILKYANGKRKKQNKKRLHFVEYLKQVSQIFI